MFLLEGYHRYEVACRYSWSTVPVEFFNTWSKDGAKMEEKKIMEMKQLRNFVEGNRMDDCMFFFFRARTWVFETYLTKIQLNYTYY